MPKEIPVYLMSETDFERLLNAMRVAAPGAAGICVAIALDWLQHIYADTGVPATFAEQDLAPLIAQQQLYRGLALKVDSDAGLLEYGASRGFRIERMAGSRVHSSGEIEPLPELKAGRGYLLCFAESSVGPKMGHAGGIYKDDRGIFVRDQNIGQVKVADEAELTTQYQKVMEGHWEEVNAQRDASRKDSKVKVTIPEYRSWTVYSVRPF